MPIPGGTADLIVSLADVRTELGKTSSAADALLQDYLDRATVLLLNHPEYRVADAVGLATHTQWHDAGRSWPRFAVACADDDPAPLTLIHYPAASVTSVTEFFGGSGVVLSFEPTDGGVFTSAGWRYTDDTGAAGMLVRTSGGYPVPWRGRVKVVYTAGSATVPADIRAAALALVDHLWESQRGGQGAPLPSGSEIEEIGGTFGQSYGPSYALPNRVREMLAAYQRGPVVA